ncbi:MAG TPA: hypothetical protein VFW96_25460 [Thermomicrobiales bacterium]|nr:hypothetical protein [Thermomicrobiales bacterium]
MAPALCAAIGAVPLPSSPRALAKQPTGLSFTALTLVVSLHLLDLCRLAVRLAHRRCLPPLPKGPGGRPRVYPEEALLLITLLRTLWRLSSRDRREWLVAWPAPALARGLPQGPAGRACPAPASRASAPAPPLRRRSTCASSWPCARRCARA